MRKRFAVLSLAATLLAWGCGDDDGDTTDVTDDMMVGMDMGTDPGNDMFTPPEDDMFVPSNTIVDVAAADDRFEILVAALERVELDDALRGTGPFTVFAPTDEAFEALLVELDVEGLDDIDDATLTLFLQNHVLEGEVLAEDIPSDPPVADNLADLTLWFGAEGEDVTVNEATVTEADITAPSNGVIHVVDDVIDPADIPAMAGIAGLSELVAALSEASLVDAVSGEGPLTVFAPTNDAFDAAFTALSVEDATGIDDALLTRTLLHHVVDGAVASGDIASGTSTAPSLAEGPVADGPTLSLLIVNDTTITINGATVTIADIKVTNGVIHVIDEVILPSDIPAMAGIAGLSDLVTALTDNSLVAPLQGAGPFTVFAPTNAAFTAADLTGADVPGTLLYHVTDLGAVAAGDLAEGLQVVPTLADPDYSDSDTTVDDKMTLLVTRTGAAVDANGANVVIADVVTTNGIVHVVDAVITRPTIPEMADLAGLSELLTAVGASPAIGGGGGSVADALATTDNLTVFAPANGAGLADAGLTGDALRDHLLYHVVPSSDFMAGELPASASPATLESTTVDVVSGGAGVTVEGQGNTAPIDVVIPDVVAANGVVHVIDGVLLLP